MGGPFPEDAIERLYSYVGSGGGITLDRTKRPVGGKLILPDRNGVGASLSTNSWPPILYLATEGAELRVPVEWGTLARKPGGISLEIELPELDIAWYCSQLWPTFDVIRALREAAGPFWPGETVHPTEDELGVNYHREVYTLAGTNRIDKRIMIYSLKTERKLGLHFTNPSQGKDGLVAVANAAYRAILSRK